jgi:type 1 fimbriae regulatory protein FimB/type 1 fimbriae regulatory protein FimE
MLYKDRRPREYLTKEEVELLVRVLRGRQSRRNALILLMMYRHGLRVSEVIGLTWDQVDLVLGRITIYRLKNGRQGDHPLSRDEIKGLRRTARTSSPYIFLSERGDKLSPCAIRKIIKEAGERADLPFPLHPHMLRHGTGYQLVNQDTDIRVIQEYLGHSSISSTVRYTALSRKKIDRAARLL